MRARVVCSKCNYSFNLPTSNFRFVEACPACFADRQFLLVAERQADSSANTPVPDSSRNTPVPGPAVERVTAKIPVTPEGKATTKNVKLPQPRQRRVE
jgi:hypothetical protein